MEIFVIGNIANFTHGQPYISCVFQMLSSEYALKKTTRIVC